MSESSSIASPTVAPAATAGITTAVHAERRQAASQSFSDSEVEYGVPGQFFFVSQPWPSKQFVAACSSQASPGMVGLVYVVKPSPLAHLASVTLPRW